MNPVPNYLDERVSAMQQEFSGQIAGLSTRCAMLAAEVAALKAELRAAQTPVEPVAPVEAV